MRPLTLLFVLCGFVFMAIFLIVADARAQDASDQRFFDGLARQQHELLKDPTQGLGFSPIPPEAAMQAYQGDVDKIAAAARAQIMKQGAGLEQAQPESGPPGDRIITLFVNSEDLRAVAERVSGELRGYRNNGEIYYAQLLVRGLPPAARTFGDLVRIIASQTRGLDMTNVRVRMNFEAFRENAVLDTPTILLGTPEDPILWARGASSPEWLLSQHELGKRGDLGKVGPTQELTDVDFKEVLAQRMAEVDWEAQRDGAAQRYWDKYPYQVYPRAGETKIRYIDPSITLDRDLGTDETGYIARVGDRINPLEHREFQRQWIIFEARDPEQVRWIKELLAAGLIDKQRFTFITSGVSNTPSFEAHTSLEDELGVPIYLLNHMVADRFQLRALPTSVRVVGDLMIVKEHDLAEPLRNVHEIGIIRD